MASVHTAFGVFVEEDAIILDASSGDDATCLAIRRPGGACELVPRPAGGWGGGRAPDLEAVGVVGLLALASGAHLMLVTHRRRAAHAAGYSVWRACAHEVLALGAPALLAPSVRREEEELVRGVRAHVLGSRCLYFSYEHDITHTAQRIATRVQRAQPLWRSSEPRFFFNRAPSEPLIGARADRWALPMILGHVHHHEGVLNGRAFDVLTISRRSARRAGVRLHTRGLGPGGCGEVAHFCETEQILSVDGRLHAHVQLRGSIPLTWAQPPRLMISDPHRSAILAEGKAGSAGCAAHISWLQDEYGPNLGIVSLINQASGAEVALGHALQRELTRLGELAVGYFPFDFHKVCARGKYELCAARLLPQLAHALATHGAFEQEIAPPPSPPPLPLPPRAPPPPRPARADAPGLVRYGADGGAQPGGAAGTPADASAAAAVGAHAAAEPPRSTSHGSLPSLQLLVPADEQPTRGATQAGARRAATAPPSPPAGQAAAAAGVGAFDAGVLQSATAGRRDADGTDGSHNGGGGIASLVGTVPAWTRDPRLPPSRLRDGCARGRIISVQTGVLRTNCVDCQDRTNVAQCEVAMAVLQAQLRHAQVLLPNETIDLHRVFAAQRRCVWADHGDAHSMLYSGTPAVKGDYVRTGRRSVHGALGDAWYSCARFVANNLTDGRRQDSFDLFLRRWTPSPSRKPTDSLYAAPPRQTLIGYGVRCVLSGLMLRAVGGLLCVRLCAWADAQPPPQPTYVHGTACVCEWSQRELGADWRLGHVIWLLLYCRHCYTHLCAHIERFVDMPRLLPGDYTPPPGGVSLDAIH